MGLDRKATEVMARASREAPGRWRPLVALWAAALVGLAAFGASALDWDQATVARLAGEFNSAVRALLADPGTNPEQDTAMQQKRHDVAIRTLQAVLRSGEQLEKMLKDGAGKDATLAVFSEMQMLLDEVQVLADESWIRPSAQENARKARRADLKLAEYYRNAE